jgi:hypothetical protein
MRVHLARVMVGCVVVVEMNVRHRRGDGAHLNRKGYDGCQTAAQHTAIL